MNIPDSKTAKELHRRYGSELDSLTLGLRTDIRVLILASFAAGYEKAKEELMEKDKYDHQIPSQETPAGVDKR